MASLHPEPSGTIHIVLRIGGRRFKRSLGTKLESQAVVRRDAIVEMLDLIKRGRLIVPEHVSVIDFLMADGKVDSLPPADPLKTRAGRVTLESMFAQFFDSLPVDNVEATTIGTMRTHQKHLTRILKPNFDMANFTGQTLQKYVNARAKETTHYAIDKSKPKEEREYKRVSATTIRKEIVTLGTVWRWAATVPLVSGPFPNRGIRLPKTDEKPPFQTWGEIEGQIRQESLTGLEADTLWDCLYLRQTEMNHLLKHVKKAARSPFIHPMFAMACYTGARRSEIMRSRRSDFNFETKFVTIREKKRVKGQRSTRRVPLAPPFEAIMRKWFDDEHPGGPWSFAQFDSFMDQQPLPIKPEQAHSHFQLTLKGSRWEKIKGWHCLRHSFISNLACSGIDQRIIDEFVGHCTEEMRRRYRHLFPDIKHAAIAQVFGGAAVVAR
ncbi:tyrosine-type recombinase/integrase [Rhodopirellula sallentina]|uniref:Site-specific recombinase, phage integrase family n=1 Tax=Rhodopirellula sallentina SM41 TaxID=1263870 RepID=M5U6L9_9BACT|nr:site-specific integrase [Rhodopirellula sallentina]EMI57117.1 site-specific recombinase, phage integrase family [Rhodopirellula sallentina SM41]